MATENATVNLDLPDWITSRFTTQGIRADVSEKGRGLVAAREFKAGDILIRSSPFSSAVAANHVHEYCNKCGGKGELKRCSQCSFVRYCSRDCQVNAWTDHKLECSYIKSKFDIFSKVLPLNSLLLLRTLEMNENEKAKQGIKKRELCPELEMLESHREDFLKIQLRKDQKSPYDIVVKTYRPFLRDREYAISEKTLFNLHCKLAVNANAFQSETGETVSSGLFPEQTLLNHSCRPNCINCFRGLEVLLVACRDIKFGEELTINYIDLIKPVWERRAMLKEKSFFECNCERCEEEVKEVDMDTEKPLWALLDKIYEAHTEQNWRQVLNLSSQIQSSAGLNLGSLKILVGRLAFEAHTELGENDLALLMLKNVIQYSGNFLSIYSHDLSTSYVRLTELLLRVGDYKEAREALEFAKRPTEIVYGKDHFWYKQLICLEGKLIESSSKKDK